MTKFYFLSDILMVMYLRWRHHSLYLRLLTFIFIENHLRLSCWIDTNTQINTVIFGLVSIVLPVHFIAIKLRIFPLYQTQIQVKLLVGHSIWPCLLEPVHTEVCRWIQKLLQYTSFSTGVYTERSPVAIEPMCGGWFLRGCGVPAVWLLWEKKRSLYRSSGACHRPECTNHAAPSCIVRKQWPKALSPWNSLYKQHF